MDETEVATAIRESMSREYSDCTWQVFVGRNFGSQVSYEETRYIYFYIAQVRGGTCAGAGERACLGAPLLLHSINTHSRGTHTHAKQQPRRSDSSYFPAINFSRRKKKPNDVFAR